MQKYVCMHSLNHHLWNFMITEISFFHLEPATWLMQINFTLLFLGGIQDMQLSYILDWKFIAKHKNKF